MKQFEGFCCCLFCSHRVTLLALNFMEMDLPLPQSAEIQCVPASLATSWIFPSLFYNAVLGLTVVTDLISAFQRQRLVNLCKFEAIQGCIEKVCLKTKQFFLTGEIITWEF